MAKITSSASVDHTFTVANGLVTPLGETVRETGRPGADGFEFRKTGKKAPPSTVSSVIDLDTAAEVKTKKVTYKALEGDVVVYTDDLGNVYSNMIVINVSFPQEKKIGPSAGGLATTPAYILRAVWTLQATDVP